MVKNQMKSKRKRFVLLGILIASTLLLCAALFFWLQRPVSPSESSETNQTAPTLDEFNLEPANAADAERVDDNKQRLIDQKNGDSSSSESSRVVTPIITYAGQYGQKIEIGAYINERLDDNGTCTAIIRKGEVILSKSVAAVQNVNSMDCPTLQFDRTQFSETGTWNVTLGYKSMDSSGSSEPQEVIIK